MEKEYEISFHKKTRSCWVPSKTMGKKFINIWDGRDGIKIARREGDNKVIETVTDFKWYFCVKRRDFDANRARFDRYKQDGWIQDYHEELDYIKIEPKMPYKELLLDDLRYHITDLYEADLKPFLRYLADNDLELDLDQRILYFDIETDDRERGIIPGSVRILSIAAVDNVGKTYYIQLENETDESEQKMLKKFLKLVDQYDIIEGWHSEGFDLVAIKRRCDRYRIRFDCYIYQESSEDLGGLHSVRKAGKEVAKMNSINHIDLMQKMKEMHYRNTELIKRVRSFSLSAVAKEMLDKDKVDLGGKGIYQLWKDEPEKLKEYNLQDVMLLKELDDKLQITKQKLIEHNILGARINDFTSIKKIDSFALKAARKMGKRLPSAKKYTRKRKEVSSQSKVDPGDKSTKKDADYVGGYVFEPVTGLHKNVYLFDFQSLYPSIIKTFNISVDTHLGKEPKEPAIKLPTGEYFRKQPGIIATIIQDLLDERNRIRFIEMKKYAKDSFEYMNLHYRQYSLKVIANSMYGVMGANFSRYYKHECAEGITLTGQYLLKMSWKFFEDKGFQPIYGDTDSIFFVSHTDFNPKDLENELNEVLDKHLKEEFGVVKSHMSMDFKEKHDKFLMQDKKKYVGYTGGEIQITGLEAKKRDTLPITEKFQRELISLLLKEDHDSDFYEKWVKDKKDFILSKNLEKRDLIFQKRLSKDIDDYKNPKLVQVQVARWIRDNLQSASKDNPHSMGSYIPYIVFDSKKGLTGIHPTQFTGEYDVIYYWNLIYAPLYRTIKTAFPEVDWDKYIEVPPRKSRTRKKKDETQT